jgi:hypothetical protein
VTWWALLKPYQTLLNPNGPLLKPDLKPLFALLQVGITNIQCEQTGLEAELRFLPTLAAGIRGRCVVDGVIRPTAADEDDDLVEVTAPLPRVVSALRRCKRRSLTIESLCMRWGRSRRHTRRRRAREPLSRRRRRCGARQSRGCAR